MIPIPRGRLVGLFAVPLVLLCAGMVVAPLLPVGALANLLLLGFAVVDILTTAFGRQPRITVERPKLFSIGRTNSLALALCNQNRHSQRLSLKLGLPETIEDQTGEQLLQLNPSTELSRVFLLRPTRRGSFRIEHLYLRIYSKYGLFFFDFRHQLDVTVEVYPDIKQLNHYLKLTQNHRDTKLGINRSRWMGSGTELESLREYQADDDSRSIDWKASTRLNRPISKVFQTETHNQITIALDCGRLMTAEQKGLNTLDHAVNALLILAHIAFNAGDSVSIVAFSDRIIGEISQLKGRDSLQKITRFITKLQPEFVESNYAMMFDYLDKTQKRRSLSIILTDMIDDINYELFKTRIAWLSRKHLVVLFLMQDSLLAGHANQAVKTLDDLYVKAAGREMLLQRNKAIAKLKHYNVNVLDVLPHELTGPLINKYLELKTRHRL